MKSYFAETVQEAVAQARRELGPEAALVTSRPSPAEARPLGRYEVVFAFDLPDAPASCAAAPNPAGKPAGARSASAEPPRDSVGREFAAWREAAFDWLEQPRWMIGEPDVQAAYFHLLDAEVDRDLAVQLIVSARQAAAGGDLRAALAAEIRKCVRVDAKLGAPPSETRIAAFVGPPGAGKTATIAKAAIRLGLCERLSVALISYDGERVAASEELRWYASLLGVPFQIAETSLALTQAIDEHRGKQLVLIDTPGFTARDLAAGREHGDYLARRDDIQKHLVLPVSMRSADMARLSAAFDVFAPSRLIFTRMDESQVYGPVLSEAVRSGRPISFFCAGQRVPEDFEAADKETLVNRLLPAVSERARKALSAA